ncbi:MAG: hypothetical protein CMG48_01465 [Candidatus Marinimicrobia bacterium]|nr:hypothetical protein [Candidatus Neomarinimicrobiota bacterium]
MLRIEKLSKSFGQKIILDEVNFEININESIGLLGKNGSGKSTFLKILVDLVNYQNGSIFYNEKKIKMETSYKSKILYLGHQPTFYPSLTAKENLLFISKIYKIDENQIIKKIVNSLNIVGLSNSINLPVSVFSSGMLRKLSISKAILLENIWEILLLDEPNDGLDIEGQEMLSNLILSWKNKKSNNNKSLLIVSHNENWIKNHTDQVMHLTKGKIN